MMRLLIMKKVTMYAIKRLVTFREDGSHIVQTIGIFESRERAKMKISTLAMEKEAPHFVFVDHEIVPVEVTLESAP